MPLNNVMLRALATIRIAVECQHRCRLLIVSVTADDSVHTARWQQRNVQVL